MEGLGGGLVGVDVPLVPGRYALITRHEGPWILGVYADEDVLRGRVQACPGVMAADVAVWAVEGFARGTE